MSSWKYVVPRPPFSFYPATAARRYGYDGPFFCDVLTSALNVEQLRSCSEGQSL